jgi:hypothetical protein
VSTGDRLSSQAKRGICTAALTIAGAVPARTAAQCAPGGPPEPAAVSKSIAGIVLDRTNHPLENVDVIVRVPRRIAKTRPDGRFLIQPLDTGVYEVTFRKIGYQIFSWEFVVTDSGGVARVCLANEVRILPPSISAVSAGGLSGIIADSMMKPLSGAEVRAMGAGEHAITDSAGAFYMDLHRGTYALMISKPGYARQLVSVTIPKDSGRQITAFLGSPQRNANRLAANLDDMRQRIAWANPSTSGLMSNEDLLNTSADLRGAAQRLARAGMADDCPAIIDGGPYVLPLSIIDKRDVAMMEAYAIMTPRRRGMPSRPVNTPCPVRIYVWMKP